MGQKATTQNSVSRKVTSQTSSQNQLKQQQNEKSSSASEGRLYSHQNCGVTLNYVTAGHILNNFERKCINKTNINNQKYVISETHIICNQFFVPISIKDIILQYLSFCPKNTYKILTLGFQYDIFIDLFILGYKNKTQKHL